jgi:hypothetical protein
MYRMAGAWQSFRNDPLRDLAPDHRRRIVRAVRRGEAVEDPTDVRHALDWIAYVQIVTSRRLWRWIWAICAINVTWVLIVGLTSLARHPEGSGAWLRFAAVVVGLIVATALTRLIVFRFATSVRLAIQPNEALRVRTAFHPG